MTNTTATAVGARLRQIRRSSKLSLNEVAEKSGDYFKASCLGAYERGDRVIPVDRLVELAAFYGFPASAVLVGIEP